MMAVWVLAGLAAGVIAGLSSTFVIPKDYTVFVAVGIFAVIDTVLGGLNSHFHKKFDADVFLSGFFGNVALAVGLAYIGVLLNLDLYIAAIVVFGTRVFNNFAEIRRFILNSHRKKDNIETK
jgi:small basic protein